MKAYVVEWDLDEDGPAPPIFVQVPDDIPADEVADFLTSRYGVLVLHLAELEDFKGDET